ncbi:MAG: HlyD family secretion protein [Verrucomicrobiales bacterium]|jgi:HlyD family secretion protein
MRVHLILVAAVALAGCGGHDPHVSTPKEAVAVKGHVAAASEVPVFEEVVGTVRPRKEAQVSAKVTGRVLEMLATPGKRVEQDEKLAEIEVGELRASLDRAKAGLAQADRELTRYRNLLDSGSVTQAEFEKVESQQRIAAATVDETQSLVDNASVKAPFDGVITRKLMEPGDFASPGRPLFSLEDSSLLRLEINAGESIAGSLKLGDSYRIQVSGANADLKGEITEIAPSADVGSRTFSIKLDLPEHPDLRAGQFGRAFLPRGLRTALSVPESALISRGQMDYVFVIEGEAARLRIVRTGRRDAGEIEILAGLDDGETIVANPAADLSDGQPVTAGE